MPRFAELVQRDWFRAFRNMSAGVRSPKNGRPHRSFGPRYSRICDPLCELVEYLCEAIARICDKNPREKVVAQWDSNRKSRRASSICASLVPFLFQRRFSFRLSRRIKTLTNGALKGGARFYVFLQGAEQISGLSSEHYLQGIGGARNCKFGIRGFLTADNAVINSG